MLYVYGLLREEPGPGEGLAGEALRAVPLPGLQVVCGVMDRAPPATPDALRAHDAAVRRLWEASSGFLPARFGELVRNSAISSSRGPPNCRKRWRW